MKNTDNIEKLFKDTFEHFEADVNPQVWSNVQSGLNTGAGGATSSVAKFAVGKITAGAASLVVIAGSVLYFYSSEDTTTQTPAKQQIQTEIASQEEIAQNIISDNQQANITPETNINRTGSQLPPAVRSLNQYASNNSYAGQSNSESSADQTSTDEVDSENTGNASVQSAPAKYGKATEGPSPFLRGTQTQKSKPFQTNTSDHNQEAEQPVNTNIQDSPEVIETSASVNFEIIPNVNVFTPNGDGKNDFFLFETKNIVSIDIEIADIKGSVVGGWNTLEGSWNGKLKNGSDAPEGVYYYMAQAKGADGINHLKKGFVTLSRKL